MLFLENYITIMESLPNNESSSVSSGAGDGGGLEPDPNKNPNKDLSISSSKRKSDEDLEQNELSQKKTRKSFIDFTNESKILNKLQDQLSDDDIEAKKIFPESKRDVVLYTQNFGEDEEGDIVEVGIDNNGKLDEAYYNKYQPEAACDCCGNSGTKNCKCGGPINPAYSKPMPPPAPRIKKPLCKDYSANPGTLSREYPCCKCRKPFGNYKCFICNCIYC